MNTIGPLRLIGFLLTYFGGSRESVHQKKGEFAQTIVNEKRGVYEHQKVVSSYHNIIRPFEIETD